MSVSVLVSGALFRQPEQRTSQNGKAYVRATLKTSGAESEFWSLMSFSSTASSALLELQDGDRLAAQGSLKVELYQGKISRTIFVDQVMALRAKKKRRDDKPPDAKTAEPESPPFDDSIPS